MAYHGYQSFAPGEASPVLVHEIGLRLAKQLWGEKYQVIVATHLDKENHLHSHFVVNTVSFVDGIKYHRTAKDYHDMQAASDALCREYGLSVIKNPGQGRSKHYGEWRAEQEGRPTWRGIIRTEIDEIIRQSMTERQFFENLRRRGYEVKAGKDISVRPPRKERFVRLERNFSPAYSIEGIRARILSQRSPERPMPEPPAKLRYARYKGSFRAVPRATGFRALYFHYCYLLGIFPKNRPKSNKRLHFLLREDLIKLDAISEEMKLLAGHRIDTGEQLFSYQDSLTGKIEALTADRKELYRKQRTVAVKSDDTGLAEVKASIAALSKELAALRREVKLCDDIAARSGVMREKSKPSGRTQNLRERRKNAMNNSGDAAEQVIRLSLEGTEVALKLTGSAAKNIAAAIYAVLKNRDKNKVRGRQRLTAMLKSGKRIEGVYCQRGTSEAVCHRSQAVWRGLLRPARQESIRGRHGRCDGPG